MRGLQLLVWLAIAALLLGLIVAAILLAPWQLRFAIDAQELYDRLYQQASVEAEAGTLRWLARAGYGYQDLRDENARKVGRMSWLSGLLSLLMVLQTLAWLAALAVE